MQALLPQEAGIGAEKHAVDLPSPSAAQRPTYLKAWLCESKSDIHLSFPILIVIFAIVEVREEAKVNR